jgi:hypothetical protein
LDCDKSTKPVFTIDGEAVIAPRNNGHRADPIRVVRFEDLKQAGLVRDWSAVNRLINHEGFPPGILLSRNKRVWREADVIAWLAARPDYSEPYLLRGAAKTNAERARRRREVAQ